MNENEKLAEVLEGTWFRCTRGPKKCQGRVESELPGCRFLVVVGARGSPQVGKIVSLDEMQERDWEFYPSESDMLRAEEFEAGRKRQNQPNQPIPF